VVDGGIGYVVERVDWFECTLPAHIVPENQDGEVAQFALFDQDAWRAMLRRGEFTSEAALILFSPSGQAMETGVNI
jgi:hypothetical protein